MTLADTNGAAPGSRAAAAILLLLLGLVVGWRVIVAGLAAAADPSGAAARLRGPPAGGAEANAATWRAQLAGDPADHVALAMLARTREADGDVAGARAAMDAALRLAPADRQTLLEAGAFHLRSGDLPQAMAALRRAVDLHADVRAKVWPVLVALLDTGRLDAQFADIARDDPQWWPAFIGHACAGARDADAVHRLLDARTRAGTTHAAERRCVVDRLQRDGRWPQAYQAWLNGLSAADRARVGYVYNGDFERPLTDAGFDWRIVPQEGVLVGVQDTSGAGGHRALRVEFANKRWSGPPVQQTLLLAPGRYRFEGRARVQRLSSWLGVQWGIQCPSGHGAGPRQLARAGPFLATSAWEAWQIEFRVPADCPVQVVRLELANPRRDDATPGDVAARLDGSAWFDDLRIRGLD